MQDRYLIYLIRTQFTSCFVPFAATLSQPRSVFRRIYIPLAYYSLIHSLRKLFVLVVVAWHTSPSLLGAFPEKAGSALPRTFYEWDSLPDRWTRCSTEMAEEC